MYYYLLEPPKSRSNRIFQEQSKRFVTRFGVAGEMVTPNPARSIDELIEIALAKGYVTIVSVGSDRFANKVVSSLLGALSSIDHRIVFGCIPREYKNSIIATLCHVTSLEQACEVLRSRYIRVQPVGVISPKKYFVTPLSLQSKEPFQMFAQFPDYQLISDATHITLNPKLTLTWTNIHKQLSPFKKWTQELFGKSTPDLYSSSFTSSTLTLETNPHQSIFCEGEIIAKTPIQATVIPDLLHFIVKRDTLSVQGKEEKDRQTAD